MNVIIHSMKNTKKRKLKIGNLIIVVVGVCLVVGIIIMMIISKFTKTETNEPHEYIATVMIDAGHGGYDGGTIAVDGTAEKDLTLAYALETGKQLEELNPDIKVVYTRTSDKVSWPEDEAKDLRARVKMAKEKKADYYFAYHINSNLDPSCSGYVSYIRKDDKEGKKITDYMSKNLSSLEWTYDRGTLTTESSPLHVVDSQKIPSILFEVGFGTNPKEIKKIENKKIQKKISKAVAKALNKHITKMNEKSEDDKNK